MSCGLHSGNDSRRVELRMGAVVLGTAEPMMGEAGVVNDHDKDDDIN